MKYTRLLLKVYQSVRQFKYESHCFILSSHLQNLNELLVLRRYVLGAYERRTLTSFTHFKKNGFQPGPCQ